MTLVQRADTIDGNRCTNTTDTFETDLGTVSGYHSGYRRAIMIGTEATLEVCVCGEAGLISSSSYWSAERLAACSADFRLFFNVEGSRVSYNSLLARSTHFVLFWLPWLVSVLPPHPIGQVEAVHPLDAPLVGRDDSPKSAHRKSPEGALPRNFAEAVVVERSFEASSDHWDAAQEGAHRASAPHRQGSRSR